MTDNRPSPEIFRHGSAWVRADFHLHTKADKEFEYQGDENDFVKSYISHLSEQHVRIGVITNHNKFDSDEFKALRKKALKDEVFLLPGVELSISDGANGIHSLIVFGNDWIADGNDYVNSLLQTLFKGKLPKEYENENGRTSVVGLLPVLEEIEKFEKDFFVIFAHVEDRSGLWEELDGGRIKDLGENETFRRICAGFQKVRTHDLPNKKCRTKVKAWLGDWYPAEVEGSDCKNLHDIGKGEQTFLKLGAFSFESVKFALLDHKNRTSKNLPIHKRSYIKSVRFDGGTLDGGEISLSPELNALIGIRGSGKSSIIEALRFGLDMPLGEHSQDSDYKQKLIRHTLGSGGKVTITAVDGFGQTYEVRRIWDHAPEVFAGEELQPGVTIRETVISKPLYFGQKDLSSSGEGFEKDLVEKLLGPKIVDIRLKIEDQKHKVQASVKRLQKLSDIATRKDENTRKNQNAEFQLERYKQHGIEDKLQKQIDFDADSHKLEEIGRSVSSLAEDVSELLKNHEDVLRNHARYKSKQNEVFFKDYFVAFQRVVQQLDSIKVALGILTDTIPLLSTKKKDFDKKTQSLKEEFAAVERSIAVELKAKGIPALRPDEYRQLSKTISQTKAILVELEKEEAKSAEIRQDLLTELSSLNDLWHKEFISIREEMDKVNANHSSLSIEVGFKEDKEAFKDFLREMMRGSGIRETYYQNIAEQFADVSEIFKAHEKADALLGSFAGVFWEYFNSSMESLLTWRVPDRFAIKYKGKELREHSLGQRASALILFVLSQKENDVIIIDQPEDDLDNQTIYQDVIKLIHSMKSDTQFIFATHNPNFPVLGDAEMVVTCEYSNNRVILSPGSIDDAGTQKRIVDIMEGGEEAFNRRKEIYGIWKPQTYSR